MQQYSLIPVSQDELNASAFRLATLLTEVDEAEAAWEEAKKAHKEHRGALRREISEQRNLIRRAEMEAKEGLTQRQIDAALSNLEEHGGEGDA